MGKYLANLGIPNCLSPVPKAVIVICGPAKCLHQLFQAICRSMEALAGINFFDFDDAAASPTQWPDRVNTVSPKAKKLVRARIGELQRLLKDL